LTFSSPKWMARVTYGLRPHGGTPPAPGSGSPNGDADKAIVSTVENNSWLSRINTVAPPRRNRPQILDRLNRHIRSAPWPLPTAVPWSLYLNAGVTPTGSILDPDLAVFERCLAVNLRGASYGIKAAAPVLTPVLAPPETGRWARSKPPPRTKLSRYGSTTRAQEDGTGG
jgi:NAD(P)-dependent dehydrogenase (short-subunit alcohol dehydrogenase family)